MKLTDFVAEFIAQQGIRHAFGLTGGAAVHFFDSIEKHPDLQAVFGHHEQTASFAAEAYSRITNNLGACFVTTGPGGTNAITGLCAAYLDSIPCLYFSGQQRLEHSNHKKPFRQMGSQQIDIVTLVESQTKYAVMLQDPKMIKYELQKATHIAKTGRPGPVWIDIPLNFQWLDINPDELPEFEPTETPKLILSKHAEKNWLRECQKLIKEAKRPLVICGYGVRLAKGESDFETFVNTYHLPFVTTWNTIDILPSDHELYVGRCGIAAQRSGNLAVQNSDLLIAVGTHLSMSLTGSNFDAFAREAKRIMVDIDPVEIDNPTVRIDVNVQCDAKEFIQTMTTKEPLNKKKHIIPWLEKCHKYSEYNTPPKEWWKQKDLVNPYVFLEVLADELMSDDHVVIDGGGTGLYMPLQSLRIKKGQRMIVSGALGAMGSGLPESIGACFANNKKRTICVIGDGSLQFNIQELQTLLHHNLPVKIICMNNDGYLSIRMTQDGFLDSKYIGSDKSGGISIPDYQKVAAAYGIQTVQIRNHNEMKCKLKEALETDRPALIEIMVDRNQELIPRLGFVHNADGTAQGRPLEDMFPFLERKEFFENMIVEPLPESQ